VKRTGVQRLVERRWSIWRIRSARCALDDRPGVVYSRPIFTKRFPTSGSDVRAKQISSSRTFRTALSSHVMPSARARAFRGKYRLTRYYLLLLRTAGAGRARKRIGTHEIGGNVKFSGSLVLLSRD